LADSLARRFQRKILVLPEQQQRVINSGFDLLPEQLRATEQCLVEEMRGRTLHECLV